MKTLNKIKRWIKLQHIKVKDFLKGNYFKFAKTAKSDLPFNFHIELSQEIKPSETFNNKIYNLTLASQKINQYAIMPNEIFSFWKIIGNPEKKFKESRAIVNGKIINEVGGGLCQISGIIYFISIMARLEILERHNHSVDLYTEETRFTPLGTDATVVYGNKDLRIKNSLLYPIKFESKVADNILKINLLSTYPIKENNLFYKVEIANNKQTIECNV